MSEYKYSPKNPIFGETGYHAGDSAEDLPGTAEQKEREAKEAAKEAERIAKEAERKANEEARVAARIAKRVAEGEERQKIRIQKENEASFVNGDFQTLFGPEGTTPDKPLSYDAEDAAAAAAEGAEIDEADETADVNEIVAVAETH